MFPQTLIILELLIPVFANKIISFSSIDLNLIIPDCSSPTELIPYTSYDKPLCIENTPSGPIYQEDITVSFFEPKSSMSTIPICQCTLVKYSATCSSNFFNAKTMSHHTKYSSPNDFTSLETCKQLNTSGNYVSPVIAFDELPVKCSWMSKEISDYEQTLCKLMQAPYDTVNHKIYSSWIPGGFNIFTDRNGSFLYEKYSTHSIYILNHPISPSCNLKEWKQESCILNFPFAVSKYLETAENPNSQTLEEMFKTINADKVDIDQSPNQKDTEDGKVNSKLSLIMTLVCSNSKILETFDLHKLDFVLCNTHRLLRSSQGHMMYFKGKKSKIIPLLKNYLDPARVQYYDSNVLDTIDLSMGDSIVNYMEKTIAEYMNKNNKKIYESLCEQKKINQEIGEIISDIHPTRGIRIIKGSNLYNAIHDSKHLMYYKCETLIIKQLIRTNDGPKLVDDKENEICFSSSPLEKVPCKSSRREQVFIDTPGKFYYEFVNGRFQQHKRTTALNYKKYNVEYFSYLNYMSASDLSNYLDKSDTLLYSVLNNRGGDILTSILDNKSESKTYLTLSPLEKGMKELFNTLGNYFGGFRSTIFFIVIVVSITKLMIIICKKRKQKRKKEQAQNSTVHHSTRLPTKELKAQKISRTLSNSSLILTGNCAENSHDKQRREEDKYTINTCFNDDRFEKDQEQPFLLV